MKPSDYNVGIPVWWTEELILFVEPDVKAVDCKRIQSVGEASLAYNVTTHKRGDDDDDDDTDDMIHCVGRLQNS